MSVSDQASGATSSNKRRKTAAPTDRSLDDMPDVAVTDRCIFCDDGLPKDVGYRLECCKQVACCRCVAARLADPTCPWRCPNCGLTLRDPGLVDRHNDQRLNCHQRLRVGLADLNLQTPADGSGPSDGSDECAMIAAAPIGGSGRVHRMTANVANAAAAAAALMQPLTSVVFEAPGPQQQPLNETGAGFSMDTLRAAYASEEGSPQLVAMRGVVGERLKNGDEPDPDFAFVLLEQLRKYRNSDYVGALHLLLARRLWQANVPERLNTLLSATFRIALAGKNFQRRVIRLSKELQSDGSLAVTPTHERPEHAPDADTTVGYLYDNSETKDPQSHRSMDRRAEGGAGRGFSCNHNVLGLLLAVRLQQKTRDHPGLRDWWKLHSTGVGRLLKRYNLPAHRPDKMTNCDGIVPAYNNRRLTEVNITAADFGPTTADYEVARNALRNRWLENVRLPADAVEQYTVPPNPHYPLCQTDKQVVAEVPQINLNLNASIVTVSKCHTYLNRLRAQFRKLPGYREGDFDETPFKMVLLVRHPCTITVDAYFVCTDGLPCGYNHNYVDELDRKGAMGTTS